MKTQERKHGGWFALRTDGTKMGTIEAEGDRYRAFSHTSRTDLGTFDSLDDAWDAIAEDD